MPGLPSTKEPHTVVGNSGGKLPVSCERNCGEASTCLANAALMQVGKTCPNTWSAQLAPSERSRFLLPDVPPLESRIALLCLRMQQDQQAIESGAQYMWTSVASLSSGGNSSIAAWPI